MNPVLAVIDDEIDDIPLERLETQIKDFASQIASATAQWLLWVAAYDRREGWRSWEMKSCAAWLSWHCGLSPRTARQHVAVAHKIVEFTEVRQAFLAGELSYSKARALCRVITPANEMNLVDAARYATAAQLDRICQLMHTAGSVSDEPNSKPADTTFRNNLDGTGTILITVPIDDLAEAEANIDTRVTQIIEDNTTPETSRLETIAELGGIGEIRSAAALTLLTGTGNETHAKHTEVLLSVDAETLAAATTGQSSINGHNINPESARRFSCDAAIQPLLVNSNNDPLRVGRKTRLINNTLRRAINHRDANMCRFPGCSTTKRLHAHHIKHWSQGGDTNLENLVTLCHFHHHSVHEGGWTIKRIEKGWKFRDPSNIIQFPKTAPRNRTRGDLLRDEIKQHRQKRLQHLAGTAEQADLYYVTDSIIADSA